jgi:AcrR family transcriptional regulator
VVLLDGARVVARHAESDTGFTFCQDKSETGITFCGKVLESDVKNRTFQQARAERTYRSILSAAALVFPQKGFDGTQVPDIAHAAGVSVGIVYRYFGDKREIFLEMLELYLREARARVTERLSPEQFVRAAPGETIARIVDHMFEEAARSPALSSVYLALSFTDPDVARMRIAAEVQDRAMLTAVLEAVSSRERIPDPRAAALAIERAVQGAAIDCALGSRSIEPEAAKRALVAMVMAWLFG